MAQSGLSATHWSASAMAMGKRLSERAHTERLEWYRWSSSFGGLRSMATVKSFTATAWSPDFTHSLPLTLRSAAVSSSLISTSGSLAS